MVIFSLTCWQVAVVSCAKKNILRIIRAFINLMSAHSYKLTIYCIQSTHSAEGWGQSGAACSSVPSSKIKNIRFSMTQTGSESEATQICMDARALLPSRERKKLSRHVHRNKRPPHVLQMNEEMREWCGLFGLPE